MFGLTERQENKLISKAIRFGVDLMPSDCADILSNELSLKTRQNLGVKKLAYIIIWMMYCSSYCCERRFALEASSYII